METKQKVEKTITNTSITKQTVQEKAHFIPFQNIHNMGGAEARLQILSKVKRQKQKNKVMQIERLNLHPGQSDLHHTVDQS